MKQSNIFLIKRLHLSRCNNMCRIPSWKFHETNHRNGLQSKKSRMKRTGPESGCVRSPCMYRRSPRHVLQIFNSQPKKECVHSGTVRTHFGRLCQKAHHGRFHPTVSAGFSEAGIALRGMRRYVEAAKAFIPLHWARRSARCINIL